MPDKEPQDAQDASRSKRCPNCHRSYKPARKWQRFCCDNCRRHFHRYGASLEKLRHYVEMRVKERVRPLEARIRALEEIAIQKKTA